MASAASCTKAMSSAAIPAAKTRSARALARATARRPRSRVSRSSTGSLFLAASKSMGRTLYEAYAWFVAAFRAAAEKLRTGDRDAPFPRGSFPLALPFVGG